VHPRGVVMVGVVVFGFFEIVHGERPRGEGQS
jgi:hypothetical protein